MCSSGWQVLGRSAGAPGDGLFVLGEVDSTSRVRTFVRPDRLEKIIMLANIQDGQKMGHIRAKNRGFNGAILASDCKSMMKFEEPSGVML
jgi:hypothetical protein